MFIEELQDDLPTLVQDARGLMSDLECAESCNTKEDFCENIRSAITKIATLKQELAKILKQAERSKKYNAT